MKNSLLPLLLLAALACLPGCRPKPSEPTRLVFRIPSDANFSTNPLLARDLDSYHIKFQLYQPLLHFDPQTGALVPILAKARPVMTVLPDSTQRLDLEIREEARWDNGAPITGHDVAFTLKAIKSPGAAQPALRTAFDFLVDCTVDPVNPKRFSLICREVFFRNETALTDLWVLPAHAFDPGGLLGGLSVSRLSAPDAETALKDDPQVLAFAESLQSDSLGMRACNGSGPYALAGWETGREIVVRRKQDWWGDVLKKEGLWFGAYPNEIVYRVIASAPAVVAELKNGQLDAVRAIPAKDFHDLSGDTAFLRQYALYRQNGYSWTYYAFNTRNPKLSDRRVREALVLLTDWDGYVQNVLFGLGTRIAGPILPNMPGQLLNPALKPSAFDPDRAKQLLAEAGWSDSDGNGVLDRRLNGKTVELKIELVYPETSPTFGQFGLLLQENCRKAGVALEPKALPVAEYGQRRKSRGYELYAGVWNADPDGSDPGQLWLSANYANGGDNLTGFGSAESDALIGAIRRETDSEKRRALHWRLQEMIAAETPCAFGYSMPDRIAVHKRFAVAPLMPLTPGFWMAGFRTAEQSE